MVGSGKIGYGGKRRKKEEKVGKSRKIKKIGRKKIIIR